MDWLLVTGNKTLPCNCLFACLCFLTRSLERKLQRPLLAKSRTLPSIPQSPTVSRVHHSDFIGGSPPRRKNPPAAATSHPKGCTLPPAGKYKTEFGNYCFFWGEHLFTKNIRRLCWIDCICVILPYPLFVCLFICLSNISDKSLIRFWQSLSKFSKISQMYFSKQLWHCRSKPFFSSWNVCICLTYIVGKGKPL